MSEAKFEGLPFWRAMTTPCASWATRPWRRSWPSAPLGCPCGRGTASATDYDCDYDCGCGCDGSTRCARRCWCGRWILAPVLWRRAGLAPCGGRRRRDDCPRPTNCAGRGSCACSARCLTCVAPWATWSPTKRTRTRTRRTTSWPRTRRSASGDRVATRAAPKPF